MIPSRMRLEDAIVYVLATDGRGYSTTEIAYLINRNALHVRKDGRPVTDAQVYAAVMRNPGVFTKEGGLIHLIM